MDCDAPSRRSVVESLVVFVELEGDASCLRLWARVSPTIPAPMMIMGRWTAAMLHWFLTENCNICVFIEYYPNTLIRMLCEEFSDFVLSFNGIIVLWDEVMITN